jgi:vacuolar-type H+-ATPase subunit E/Vma4
MEDDIKLRCLPKDNEVVKSVISEAAQEYSDFLKKETGIQKTVKIELVESLFPSRRKTPSNSYTSYRLGGVMLYCARNRIVFTNTIDQRFKICVQDSIPDFRNTLFPSLYRPPLERKQPEAAHHE